ncbi:MAG TPA: molybdenum cofactor guanylyltransferase [Devosia sp.]|nr:molybdenum cofactor guanylyltransferase [Devosia sp.]
MSLPYALIIAGGDGQRLGGVRKAELRIGGQRLIDRVTARLGAVASPLLVATGHGRLPPGDHIGVADLNAEFGGPLAGLAAAVDWLAARGITNGLIASAAVDTPFLPQNFIATMAQALGPHPAIFAAWGAAFYPPNALWQISALAALPAQIRAGTAPKSLKALLAEIGAARQDWQPACPLDPFDNLNTLADLIRLQRRAIAEQAEKLG